MSSTDTKRKKFRIESDEEDEDVPVNTGEQQQQEQAESQDQPQDQPQESESKDEETAPSPNVDGGEEMDDLFGDDDDDEEADDNDGIDSKPVDDEGIVRDDEEEDEDDFRAKDGMEFAVEDTKPQREMRQIDLDVVRHPPAFQHEDGKLYDVKIPNFLQVDPTRFEAKAYLEELIENAKESTKDEIELNRLRAENTIRWRYAKDSNGELIHESNAQVIEWSDGSLSLKLGEEYFDVIQSELTDTFLATYSEESSLLTTDGIFTNSMKIVPTSTNSKIHKKLTTAIQAKNQTKPGAQSVYVDRDPEQEARALEKQQEQLIRERRRKELKERKENERYDSDTPRVSGSQRVSRESYYATPRTRDEYEEDEFMVDDDEDVEEDDEDDDLEAAERLRRVKNEGAAKYDNEEGEEEEEDVDDDEEEAAAKARKKRRVIESDEDEE